MRSKWSVSGMVWYGTILTYGAVWSQCFQLVVLPWLVGCTRIRCHLWETTVPTPPQARHWQYAITDNVNLDEFFRRHVANPWNLFGPQH